MASKASREMHSLSHIYLQSKETPPLTTQCKINRKQPTDNGKNWKHVCVSVDVYFEGGSNEGLDSPPQGCTRCGVRAC